MPNKRPLSELDCFFNQLKGVSQSLRTVTASAFSQYRDKIGFPAFEPAAESLTQYFYTHYSFAKYHRMRLAAIYGTILTLPRYKETIEEFGDNVLSKGRTWIKAQVSFAGNVLNGTCPGAFIGAYREPETKQAMLHLDKLGANNLYIFDRGYFGRESLYKVYQTGSQSCFRVQVNACSGVIAFIKSGASGLITTIGFQDQQINVGISRVTLKNGEQEYLVTSLTHQKKFSLKSLKELYHNRWGVEEQYRDIKHALAY